MIEWRTIPGFSSYEAGSGGDVRSYRGSVAGRVLRPSHRRYKLLFLTPDEGDRPRCVDVHVVVAAAFLGPRPVGMHINHRNLDKHDNRPGNLEYVTRTENIRHAYQAGAFASHIGRMRAATHCLRGHLYDAENTAITTKGTRRCRTCARTVYAPVQNAKRAARVSR